MYTNYIHTWVCNLKEKKIKNPHMIGVGVGWIASTKIYNSLIPFNMTQLLAHDLDTRL